MKNLLLLWVGLLLFTTANAQIGYRGQSAASIGIAKTNCGYLANLSYLNQVTTRSAIGGEFLYNIEKLTTADGDTFMAQQFFVGGVYQYPLVFGRFGLFPSAACLFGGEFADKTTTKGNILKYGNKFVFGVSLNIPIGFIINRRVTLYADPRIIYLPNSNFENCIVSIGVGTKFYF